MGQLLGDRIEDRADDAFDLALGEAGKIGAQLLDQFGTGPVRGFAVALLAGIAASLVSAIFVVRTFFLIWLHRTGGVKPVSI